MGAGGQGVSRGHFSPIRCRTGASARLHKPHATALPSLARVVPRREGDCCVPTPSFEPVRTCAVESERRRVPGERRDEPVPRRLLTARTRELIPGDPSAGECGRVRGRFLAHQSPVAVPPAWCLTNSPTDRPAGGPTNFDGERGGGVKATRDLPCVRRVAASRRRFRRAGRLRR